MLLTKAARSCSAISAVSVILLALAGCERTVEQSSTDISGDETRLMLRRTLEHDGIEREYFVHVPRAVSGDTNLPVVVAIHGYTSTATGFAAYHGLNRHADEHGYIVVYPQGSHFAVDGPTGSFTITSWNDLAANQPATAAGPHCTPDSDKYPCPPECGECNRCAWTSCYDDVGFIEKLLNDVQTTFNTDTQRYYLLGVSNGGMMTLRLGCSLPHRFAAIAPIIGQLAPGYVCGPDVDLPMMHLFGGEDDTVRFNGTAGSDGFIYTTAAETAAVWAQAMNCKSGPTKWQNRYSQSAGLECTAYSGCPIDDHEIVSCIDPNGTHVWPSQRVQGVPATCVTPEQYDSIPGQARCETVDGEYTHDGMDLVWGFLSRYQRSR